MHSFGILIFISRFRAVAITALIRNSAREERGRDEIKGPGKCPGGILSLLIRPVGAGLMIMALRATGIISDRSFRLLCLLTARRAFIAAGRINYLFHARDALSEADHGKEFPRTSWHSHDLFRFARYAREINSPG